MAHLARIAIYPFKSLDPLWVDRARVQPDAGLAHDRRFALVDEQGKLINGKRTPAVHDLATTFDPVTRRLTIGLRGQARQQTFQIDEERDLLQAWLSRHFQLAVRWQENDQQGFPDDLEAPGPTLISTATLRTVAGWFDSLTLDDARLRFRANLEIDGVEPFWEDRLYATAGTVRRFRIGSVILGGTNPCQRCVVPTRSPTTGAVISGFAHTFAVARKASLPGWAEASRFNHFYRLAVNTRTLEAGELTVGDELQILDVL